MIFRFLNWDCSAPTLLSWRSLTGNCWWVGHDPVTMSGRTKDGDRKRCLNNPGTTWIACNFVLVLLDLSGFIVRIFYKLLRRASWCCEVEFWAEQSERGEEHEYKSKADKVPDLIKAEGNDGSLFLFRFPISIAIYDSNKNPFPLLSIGERINMLVPGMVYFSPVLEEWKAIRSSGAHPYPLLACSFLPSLPLQQWCWRKNHRSFHGCNEDASFLGRTPLPADLLLCALSCGTQNVLLQ